MPSQPAPDHIGARVRIARLAAGLTQSAMGDFLDRSEHWVQDVEAGRLALDRYSLIIAIADLTDVDIVWLLGQPYRLRHSPEQAHAYVPALRSGLRRSGLILSGHPGLAPQAVPADTRSLRERTVTVNLRRQAADLPAVARLLPALVEDLNTALLVEEGVGRARTLRLMADAARTARMCLNSLGYPDLAWVAAEVAAGCATALDDPAVKAAVAWDRCGALLHQAAIPETLAVAEAALRDLEPLASRPHPEPAVLSLRGALMLRGAIADARGSRPDGAWARIQEALADADRLGPTWHDIDAQTVFGRGTVAVHAAEVGVEVEEPDRGLTAVPEADISAVPSKERRTHYEIDRARAYRKMGKLSAATLTLRAAGQGAPYYTYADPMARALVADLAHVGVPSQAAVLSSLIRNMELVR
ncbi:helix-turn-helix domain-containing protein [Streptomyces sp. AC536]|uniref:helix-turn-helix domain-containing protein n=1 Tax=Streptomyces buecherae TaxID=2763006 RepID=UPI00164DF6F2|nr:helix-turn-helix transcriptional regulator [Streptomyces buecherae]MBC3985150.1 helix-turn-helix domain-containing protein [Streptomyces buecherae]QNJ42356.1 helix-turn-helix domain-containing protein [Streptomyces buecherae]